TRVISDPTWLKNFYSMNGSGGPMLDLHIHDAHFIRTMFGMPKAVRTLGRLRGDVPEYFNTHFVYNDSDLVVTATSGCIQQQARPFTFSYEVHFEKATVFTDCFNAVPVTVLHEDGTIEKPEFPAGDDITPFEHELTEARNCFLAGKPSAMLDGALARDALTICHKEIDSCNLRTQVMI
ncbi:MAG: gfo/Idh/MocA family oxidoreductase, partial [Thermoguttaceae bacterium]|nr:gfo/Idh/MocA family oxidoreductase [Thermoguttaceae bacterium]